MPNKTSTSKTSGTLKGRGPAVVTRMARLTELRPDPRNANDGSERGHGMIEASLRKYGAGRSILVDRHGVIIGGNKTHEAAVDIGLEDAIVVPTDGRRLVVVQRTDLDLAKDPRAAELGLADNRAGEVSLTWNTDVLEQLASAGVRLDELWTASELEKLLPGAEETAVEEPTIESQFMVLIACTDEQQQVTLLERFTAEGLACKALLS
jgi:hypothetical protein